MTTLAEALHRNGHAIEPDCDQVVEGGQGPGVGQQSG